MALNYHPIAFPSIPANPNSFSSSSSSSNPSFFPFIPTKTKTLTSFSISATPNPNSPSSPIFLPFLQPQQDRIDVPESQNPQIKIDPDDPFLKFFKSQSEFGVPDPGAPGRMSLQKNRRTSWHLAPNSGSLEHAEPDLDDLGSMELDVGCKDEGILGEIMQIARSLNRNLTFGEVLGPYVGKIGEEECVELLKMMGQEGLVLVCLYFFEWMGLQEPPLITPRACTVLFPEMGRAGMGDKLMVLYRNLPRSTQFKDVHVYNAVLSGLSCCGRYEDAWMVYEEMETKNVLPDHVTCSIMITIMRKHGHNAKYAWEFFERMNRKGAKWSPEVLGALTKSFCDEGLKNEALILISEMEKHKISPNAIVYNTLMNAYVKSNQVEEAEGIFSEMKAKGVDPTSATYNILMDAYSRRMQPEVIEDLMREMEDLGLEPNVKSYTCLISAYGRQRKKSEMAADSFLRMKKVGIKPTSHSYTALIHAFSVDGWHEKAYTAFENMKREGIKPSIETYTALLDAFRRAGDTQTLMKIWKSMMDEKIEGTRVTFNILLDGFAKQGHYMEARDVISEFGKMGFEPTVMTYNMLMNACGRGGKHSKLPDLLKEMAARNLKPDSFTYSTMIYAYVRVRDFKRAFYYHKMMVKSGQVPDHNTYEKLRAILDVKAATKNRKDKSAILGIINSKMGLLKAKKGKKDEFWKNKSKRARTYGSLRSRQ